MGARHAVLLTPSKCSGSFQLLFYKQSPSVSPLFATLTSRPQLTEKTATLSLFLATHTASSPVTPVFATLTKTAGVSLLLFPFWFTPRTSGTRRSSLATTPLFSHSYELLCSYQKSNSFVFIQFQTLSKKHRGWGGDAISISGASLPRPWLVRNGEAHAWENCTAVLCEVMYNFWRGILAGS